MQTRWGIHVPMRDGTQIVADLFLPEETPVPVILVRTPYGRQTEQLIKQAQYFAQNGYAVLNADVRGRGDSEGNFIPYRNEGKDGYDAIEWAAVQSWSTGKVGTLGGSYLAKVQWLTALEQPPHLAAMVPLVSPSDPFVEWPTGVPIPSHICWLFMTSGKMLQNTNAVSWHDVYRHLPLATMDEAVGRDMPMWREEFRHSPADPWWDAVRYQYRFHEIDLPVLHISGWYDDEQVGTPLNFMGMRRHAKSDWTKQAQRLIMGPWPHQVNQSTKVDNVDFGEQAVIDLQGIELRFFDRWLKGIQNGVDEEAPVSIFVMGKNEWREETEWPPARAEFRPFYFHKDGHLSEIPPVKGTAPSTYTYDPEHPMPYITGPTSAQIGGADDYQEVHQREDVLVFTSETLNEAIEVTGPIQVELYAASSAKDTDFMAQLHDVWPNGFTQRLCDGMVRSRFRNGMKNPALLTPGQVTKFTIDCWNTSHVFLPGHRICVHVTSSAFPKYDRNLNTGKPLGFHADSVPAKQTVYHDAAYPSAIVLPVIPDES